jgi:hypothetical protein
MARNNKNPSSRGDATGADDGHSVRLDYFTVNLDGFHSNCSFSFIRGGAVRSIKGRDARTLCDLIGAAARGCTPMQSPAPRCSAYVHKLRERGVPIEALHPTTWHHMTAFAASLDPAAIASLGLAGARIWGALK